MSARQFINGDTVWKGGKPSGREAPRAEDLERDLERKDREERARHEYWQNVGESSGGDFGLHPLSPAGLDGGHAIAGAVSGSSAQVEGGSAGSVASVAGLFGGGKRADVGKQAGSLFGVEQSGQSGDYNFPSAEGFPDPQSWDEWSAQLESFIAAGRTLVPTSWVQSALLRLVPGESAANVHNQQQQIHSQQARSVGFLLRCKEDTGSF